VERLRINRERRVIREIGVRSFALLRMTKKRKQERKGTTLQKGRKSYILFSRIHFLN